MPRILVAEDSPTQAAHLQAILELAGLEVVLAEDAEQALILLDQVPVDLVVSDINMPGMSGYDLCRRIKASPVYRSLPVVLLSTLSEPMDIIRGLECGADNFLTKTSSPELIVDRIQALLENRKLRRSVSFGVEILFLGQRFMITSEKEQILDLLITTFEDTVRANRERQRYQTELTAAKSRLEENTRSLERYRLLAEIANDIILFVDRADLTILDANTAALKTYGYERSEIVGKPSAMLHANDDLLEFETAAQSGTQLDLAYETLHKRADGTIFPVEVFARAANFEGRSWIIKTIRDISERRRAAEQIALAHEETLEANRELERRQTQLTEAQTKLQDYALALEGRVELSEEKFRGFLNASPDAMLVVDDRGRIVIASQRVEPLFGYLPEELLGQPFNLLIPERFHAAHVGHTRDFMQAPRARDMGIGLDLYALRKDGSEFPTEISLNPHRTSDGVLIIAAVRDITVRKQAEAALQRSQKMEAVGQLTSGVAHDFNNVLGAVIGNLDLLTELIADNPRATHYAEASLAAALSGAELAKRMLAFSRRQPLRPQPFDVRNAMASVLPIIRRTVPESITIVEEFAEDLWLARADASQVENAVLNLAINARDAMPDGGTLTIDCRNTTVDDDSARAYGGDFHAGEYVVIGVTDTGHGMAPEVVAKAFDPFFTTKAQGVGTGLGLSMVLGTMKQSGGTATIYSEVGGGTTVRLYLPRSIDSKRPEDARAIGAPTPLGGSERVLVVEDNDRLRAVSCSMLTGLGYSVTAVESADEALVRIRGGERFDLVFSDIVMPGTHTGITLARELRATDPDLKVLLTSGYAGPSRFRENLEELGIDILAKPFRKVELAARIRTLLDPKGHR